MGTHGFNGKKATGHLHQRVWPVLADTLFEAAAGEGFQALGDL